MVLKLCIALKMKMETCHTVHKALGELAPMFVFQLCWPHALQCPFLPQGLYFGCSVCLRHCSLVFTQDDILSLQAHL